MNSRNLKNAQRLNLYLRLCAHLETLDRVSSMLRSGGKTKISKNGADKTNRG